MEAEERQRQEEDAARNRPKVRLLSEQEKDEMITALREKWDELNKAYRQLPVTINTVAQKTK